MRGNDSRWLLGGCMAVLCVVSLVIASRAADATFLWAGLLFCLAGVATIFNLIRNSFDEAEGKTVRRLQTVPAVLAAVAVGSLLFHLVSPWWWAPIASNWGYIDDTINLTFWITGIVFVAVVLFTAWCAYRYRHREGSRAAYEPESARLEWGLSVATALGVAVMLAPGLFVWNQFISAPDGADEIEAVGQQWSWSFRLPGQDGRLGTTDVRLIRANGNPLGINPDDPAGHDDIVVEAGDLHLPIGRPVRVLLRSVDVLHSFYVPEFRTKMDMVPGMISQIWFTPTRTGQFHILCAELCGTGHAYMRGSVVVQDEARYQAWLADRPTFAQLAGLNGPGRTPRLAADEAAALPAAGAAGHSSGRHGP